MNPYRENAYAHVPPPPEPSRLRVWLRRALDAIARATRCYWQGRHLVVRHTGALGYCGRCATPLAFERGPVWDPTPRWVVVTPDVWAKRHNVSIGCGLDPVCESALIGGHTFMSTTTEKRTIEAPLQEGRVKLWN
jgi:hypothetical protein